MPSSNPKIMAPVIAEMIETQPFSVLDIGVGYGKYGALAREYLDARNGRPDKKDWRIKVDGVEAYEPYVSPAHDHWYNDILIGRVERMLPNLDHYDLILAIDVIEHIEREMAMRTMLELLRLTLKKAIFAIPLGRGALALNRGYARINKHEAHLSAWERDEIESLPYWQKTTLIDGPHYPNGLFVFEPRGE